MARSLNPSAAETIYHDDVWIDARGYATVRLPAEAGLLEPPLELELRDLDRQSRARVADRRRIAYCSGQGGGPVQIWTMKQNGKDKQQVTHMSGAAIFPDYSPDGSEIIFAAQPAGATARNIYVVPSDGGTPQRLTTVGNNVYPAFSPDGRAQTNID